MKHDLADCPFCGEGPELVTVDEGWYVRCRGCGCVGPGEESEEEACVAWNERATGGWISVEERLPEAIEGSVLVWPRRRGEVTAYYLEPHNGVEVETRGGGWFRDDANGYPYRVHPTHWQALPSPPVEEAS